MLRQYLNVKLRVVFELISIIQIAFLLIGTGVFGQQSYESYYLYLGNNPDDACTDWSERINGISHDEANWFIAQEKALWRIPARNDLKRAKDGVEGTVRKKLSDYSELTGYNHFGDLTYFDGYLFVPIEHDKNALQPAIVVFKNDEGLTYVDHYELLGEQTRAGWVAIDPDRNLYGSSNKNVDKIFKYSIDWDKLDSPEGRLELSNFQEISIFDSDGSKLTLGGFMQGGVFTPSGDMLYLVSGKSRDVDRHREGIHVFDVASWRRIQHSTNGSGYFNYEWHPGIFAGDLQEPEGITIWNMEDVSGSTMDGELHVLVLDNDAGCDDIYLKHYSRTIHVDHSHSGNAKGRPAEPFKSISTANDFAWDGAQLKIASGSYRERIIFEKRIRVVANGGSVVIGK